LAAEGAVEVPVAVGDEQPERKLRIRRSVRDTNTSVMTRVKFKPCSHAMDVASRSISGPSRIGPADAVPNTSRQNPRKPKAGSAGRKDGKEVVRRL
jgi:hypothetical protein